MAASEVNEFRIYAGPIPDSGTATLLVGLAAADGVAGTALKVSLDGTVCSAAADLTDTSRMAGVARALRFDCPLAALKPGYNTFTVGPDSGADDQQIVWGELRFDPE